MSRLPKNVAAFLSGKRYAVAGVSRDPKQAANAIFRRLVASGFEVIPVNPQAAEVEGVRCYPDLASIPGEIDGVVIATPPAAALSVVQQCAAKGVKHVWFHRSFGAGSVSKHALDACKTHGIAVLEGGCPLMYCEPVDGGHKCIRWWLRLLGKVPE
jgi:uncharacterized protein